MIVTVFMCAGSQALARATVVCKHWRALVQVAVRRLGPGCLRHLAAREDLVQRVGEHPERLWSAEWGPLLAEEFRLRGYPGPNPEDVALGEHSIEAMLRALVLPISWLLEAGWEAKQAERDIFAKVPAAARTCCASRVSPKSRSAAAASAG